MFDEFYLAFPYNQERDLYLSSFFQAVIYNFSDSLNMFHRGIITAMPISFGKKFKIDNELFV